MRKTGQTVLLKGNFISVSAQSQGYNCGRLLRDIEGSIESPDNDGDGQYDSNQYCRWTILADENKMVQLEIFEMDIEEEDDCFNDYLAVSFKSSAFLVC